MRGPAGLKISVVVPVYDGARTLHACLQAISDSHCVSWECIVIDDGSADDSSRIAGAFGATVLSTGGRFGPAKARNLGARQATGDVLMFLDADVAVHSDAIGRVIAQFTADPELDALIGSYDDSPADPGLVSQFKNLMHAFVHGQGNPQASTFWCGCGAVRRSVYLELGGLDEAYSRPSIEDIEFGYRMRASGRKLTLDPSIQCKHLKSWTLWSLVRTDVMLRGVPWTELILRTRVLPDDLNLRWNQRASVILSALAPLLAAFGNWPAASASAVCLLTLAWINRAFYAFLVLRKGVLFAVSAVPLHILYFLYSGLSVMLGVASHLLRQKAIVRPEIENNPEW